MGLLDGKTLLVTGVLTDASIAFHVARAFLRRLELDGLEDLGPAEAADLHGLHGPRP